MVQYKILLVHNKFRVKDPVTYLSWLIRVVTGGEYNHIAVQVDNDVIESIGKGVIKSSFEDWYKRSDRKILPRRVPFSISQASHDLLISRIGNHYGKWDLLATGVYFLLKYRLGLNIPKPINGAGDICSELGLMLLGLKEILVPHQFEELDILESEEIYYTTKSN